MEEYKESKESRDLKSQIAEQKPRDEDGHFIKVEEEKKIEPDAKDQNPVLKFLTHHTTEFHSGSDTKDPKDDLLDLRIHNPLKRVTELLEDIKKQKAFNFTVKGSLGIMGVFLTLSLFGIFGGGQILCEKGTQVEIGTIKQLQVLQEDPSDGIPVLTQIIEYFIPKQRRPKYVLIKSDETVFQIPYSRYVDFAKFVNFKVVATGSLNACSNTLTITDPTAIELYNK